MADNFVEGHSGYTIEQVYPGTIRNWEVANIHVCSEIRDQAKKSLPDRPNLILVHEGTVRRVFT